MRTCRGSRTAEKADGAAAERNAEPSKNNRELARLIGGDDLSLALSTLEKISSQRALAYLAKNGPTELQEKSVGLLTGMLDRLTDTGAILVVALRSNDADAKAAAGAKILNMDKRLIFEKPRKELTQDETDALAYIARNHPDDFKRGMADCKLPSTSKSGGLEFVEEVVTFDSEKLAEILEADA